MSDHKNNTANIFRFMEGVYKFMALKYIITVLIIYLGIYGDLTILYLELSIDLTIN